MTALPSNASDHLPAGAINTIIHWLYSFGGAGQVYCVVRRSGLILRIDPFAFHCVFNHSEGPWP